ncbi:MAG: cell division topological specificity factor MinE [Bacillota bacterium]|nr:cell division topological specificity factor MinE [Bacillota bacterium]
MLDIIGRFFGKDNSTSREIAKERLRLVLVHDRALISPEMLNALKEDLIKVIQTYMDIDLESLVVDVENEDNAVALIANIPIKGLKRAVND